MQLIPTATDANCCLNIIRPGTANTLSHLNLLIVQQWQFMWEGGRGGGGGKVGGKGTRYKLLHRQII
jgi:hypothetical protein